MTTLTDRTLLKPNPGIIFGDVDGEIVALNIESGNYLHLNSSGSFIFSLLDETSPKAVAWLFRAVQQDYAVDETNCQQEVGAFLRRCIDLNLICIAAESS
nr:PqqD family protein [uncultured Rhodoferax sp.]